METNVHYRPCKVRASTKIFPYASISMYHLMIQPAYRYTHTRFHCSRHCGLFWHVCSLMQLGPRLHNLFRQVFVLHSGCQCLPSSIILWAEMQLRRLAVVSRSNHARVAYTCIKPLHKPWVCAATGSKSVPRLESMLTWSRFPQLPTFQWQIWSIYLG